MKLHSFIRWKENISAIFTSKMKEVSKQSLLFQILLEANCFKVCKNKIHNQIISKLSSPRKHFKGLKSQSKICLMSLIEDGK